MNTTAKADIQFDFANINTCPYCQDCGCPTTTTTTATTATTTTATTTTTTSATTTTTTSATTVTTTSATTTTTTSQTTMTTRSPVCIENYDESIVHRFLFSFSAIQQHLNTGRWILVGQIHKIIPIGVNLIYFYFKKRLFFFYLKKIEVNLANIKIYVYLVVLG